MFRLQHRYLSRSLKFSFLSGRPFPSHLNSYNALTLSSSNNKGFDDIHRNVKKLREEVEIQHQQEPDEHKLLPKPSLSTWVVDYIKNPKKLGHAVWEFILHTYHGLRLFCLEVWISVKYIIKLRRRSLTRRERNQLFTTLADTLRLGPFMVFIIVPFMDFLIPFYIKFFPHMLPSTFHGFNENNMRQFKVKLKAAKFLRETLDEITEINEKKSKTIKDESKAVKEQAYITNADLFKFINLFEDELTLDNLTNSQLEALCRLLGIARIGTKELLRFRLQRRLKELQADDRLIAAEGGVEMLSVDELQAANKARGMRAYGVSEKKLKKQLKQWLELSLDDKVPPSLLLLSRAMFFPEELNFTERLRSIITSLPEEIGEHTTLKLKELEGTTDPKKKIEVLKGIESALKEEKKDEIQRAKDVEAANELKEQQKKAEAEIELEQKQQKELESPKKEDSNDKTIEEMNERNEFEIKDEQRQNKKDNASFDNNLNDVIDKELKMTAQQETKNNSKSVSL